MTPLQQKDLLDIKSISKEQIFTILETARHFKKVFTKSMKKLPTLQGKTVALLFYEASTRTRTSFELAAKRLGADIINISVTTSSVTKGESLIDTVKTLSSYNADYIVIRHKSPMAPHLIARKMTVSVINGGDGNHSHPTQALLDAYTLFEKWGHSFEAFHGKRVGIVGDILHSRVARSNIYTLQRLGAQVVLCGPKTLLPDSFKEMGVELSTDLDSILPTLDAINMLRVQFERHQEGDKKESLIPSVREYQNLFSLTQQRLNRLNPNLLLLHPGPINRGIEIDDEVADGKNSLINTQVTNGVAIRMATFYLFRPPQPSALATPELQEHAL